MNSAAVIGRQLRQQHPPVPSSGGRTAGPPRTPSHAPHQPPAQSPPKQQPLSPKPKSQPEQQEKGQGTMLSCRCIWLCFKALSGGVLLIAIGVGMTVFGFYADHFAVHEQLDAATNRTTRVVNEHLKLHLHNLTYVGPVFMGLGGMMIVAACVLIDARQDELLRDDKTDVTEHLIESSSAATAKSPPPSRCNGPMAAPFFSLDLPPARVQDKGGGAATTRTEIVTVAEVAPPTPVPQDTPSSSVLSSPRVLVRSKHRKKKVPRSFLSPLYDVPSPADIQILDPDGCTPDGSTFLEMDVFRATKCHPRLQFEPRYLASIESDGLSDSDTTESGFNTTTHGSRQGGGYCSPCESEQDTPLLGMRCSPPSSPEYPMEPLLKRDRTGLRRFQLMRQVPRTSLFDEGGGSR